MMSPIWVLEAILLGCLLVYRFTDLPAIRPAWARVFLIFGTGTAGGVGLASGLFFVFGVLFGMPVAAMVLELALLAWAGYETFRRRMPMTAFAVESGFPLLLPVTVGGLLLVLGIVTVAMSTAWEANPHGNWDAWAIWNLRARFLAADSGLAQRAWSPALGATTHAEYPLLVSSFVARCWSFGHSSSTFAPAATSYLFFLALIALAAGGVAVLRGPTLGCLLGLVLASTPPLLHEVPAQYADVPLACYFAGALIFTLLERPVLAGIFAGFAAWTKDEGLLFLLVFLAATALWKRRAFLVVLAGAVPAGALVIYFKAWLARGNPSLLSTSLPGAPQRIADVGRYGTVIAAFAREFLDMASGWYHPIFPLIVLAIALRFDRVRRRDVAFCGSILAALLLGYSGIFILSSNDLTWHLQTALGRLFVQIWPALMLTGFLALRAPEAAVAARPGPAPKTPKKTRR